MFSSIRHGLIRLSCTKLLKRNLRRKDIKGLQITRETDYAIRIILHLAKKDEHWATADEIASKMDVPKTFLHKIVKRLEKSGIVKLKRGVKGGIGLLKNPREITLYDVIIAMEKSLAINRCIENSSVCKLLQECPVHPVWHKIRGRLISELKEINFFQLAGAA